MPKVVLCQTLNYIRRNYFTFVKREIQTNTFNFTLYKCNEYTYRHLKGAAFFQRPISCKISKICEKIPKKFVKLHNL